MVRYSKPVWQMVKEAAERADVVTAKDVKEFIKENYPDDNVNELTINAQVIACSVNHSSAHHYSDTQRFLFYLGNGRYRIYHPERDGIWDITRQGAKKVSKGITSGGAYFSRVSSDGQVMIPKTIQDKLSIKKGDFVAFVEDKTGSILLKRGELRIVD